MTLPPSPNSLPTTEGVTQGWQVPDGWKLVPIEPTEAMNDAASEYDLGQDVVYRAMIEAAPLPPPPGQ